MPRKSVSEGKRPIVLKSVLATGGITAAEFAAKFTAETGVRISKTSVVMLLDYGEELKRVGEFKSKVMDLVRRHYGSIMERMNIQTDELFNEIQNNTTMEDNMAQKYERLTQDAIKHFNVRRDPFPISLSGMSEFLRLESHMTALDMMRETANYNQFAAITGNVGSGKTTVLTVFEEENRISEKFNIIKPKAMDSSRVRIKDVQISIVMHLSDQSPKRNDEQLSWQVEKLLRERAKNNEKTVLIIDEAHRLHTQTLKALKNLLELKDGFTSLIAIILIGQEELEERLYGRGNMEVREVAGRINHIKLNPINNELESFLKAKFDAVKLDIKKVITPEAIKLLSEKWVNKDKNGIREDNAYPLEIGNNIKRMMNYCAYAGEEIITPDVIKMIGV